MENNPLPPENTTTDEAATRFNIFILLVPLAFILGLVVGYALWGRSGAEQTTAAAANPPAATPAATQQIKRYPVPVDDDPAIGPADAPITIIEFSDFQCPYCRKWYDETYQKLLQTYPDKVRFVYRDFPLTSIHPEAQPAAEAAQCANEQGVYWKYYDKLFSNESELGTETYKKYAAELGLDTARFDKCLADRTYQKEVEADLEYASNLGVNSTPTFFINGIAVVGAQPFEVFQYIIDKELAGELPQ
jgi:protein-disulfide isomerase